MNTTLDLSERQQQVLDLLNQDVGAREIGERLGISRNAVYQTISRLKKHGVLPEHFTPTAPDTGGRPTRRLLSQLVSDGNDADTKTSAVEPRPEPVRKLEERATSLSVELAQELARTQQELAAIANRLSRYL